MLYETRQFRGGILKFMNPPRKNVMTQKKKEAAIAMLKEGVLTVGQIAEELEVSTAVLYKTLPAPRRTWTPPEARTPPWHREFERLVVETDLSIIQIATRLGLHRNTIYKYFPAARIAALRKKKRDKK